LTQPEEIFLSEWKKFGIFRGNIPKPDPNQRWLTIPDPCQKYLTRPHHQSFAFYYYLKSFFQKIKHLAEDVSEQLKIDKKEIFGKLDAQGSELKRKIEVETNEIR